MSHQWQGSAQCTRYQSVVLKSSRIIQEISPYDREAACSGDQQSEREQWLVENKMIHATEQNGPTRAGKHLDLNKVFRFLGFSYVLGFPVYFRFSK